MDYNTVLLTRKKDKDIVFYLNGPNLTLESLVDVEIHVQPERSKREDSEHEPDIYFYGDWDR